MCAVMMMMMIIVIVVLGAGPLCTLCVTVTPAASMCGKRRECMLRCGPLRLRSRCLKRS